MIRKDWLDKLGYTYDDTKPVTLEWFTQVMNDITFKDPDGNGINDTYGLAAYSTDGNLGIAGAARMAYGLSGWREYDGEYMDLQYSRTNDAFKKALAWTAEQYKLGTIDPDWATIDRNAEFDRFQQGVTGILDEFVGWMTDKESMCRQIDSQCGTELHCIRRKRREPEGRGRRFLHWLLGCMGHIQQCRTSRAHIWNS